MILLGLGSSIGNAEEIFDSAEQMMGAQGIKMLKKSSILKNPPFGNVAKNEFSNAVWAVETNLSAEDLLVVLQKIEAAHGRDKTSEIRWGDRSLDIDILTFGKQVIDSGQLQIPHPGIPERDFVLKPMAEIVDENFEIPTFGPLQKLLKHYEH